MINLPELTKSVQFLMARHLEATGRHLDIRNAKARTIQRDGRYMCELSFPCGATLVMDYDEAAYDLIAAGHAVMH